MAFFSNSLAIALAGLLLTGSVGVVTTNAAAQTPEIAQESKEEVRYRCVKWKKRCIHDQEQADKIAKTLKDLNCEVKIDAHNGHVDLKYRCPNWRKMSLASHADAHKWEAWLKKYGFETEHHH